MKNIKIGEAILKKSNIDTNSEMFLRAKDENNQAQLKVRYNQNLNYGDETISEFKKQT